MNEEQLAFIEDLGIVFERSGTTPMLGRVFAALLVSAENQHSAEELATILHASRGAISQATRQLMQMGVIRKVRTTGVRKDLFQVVPDGWVEASYHKLLEIREMQKLFQRGLDSMPDTSEESRLALKTNLAFVKFWAGKLPEIFEEWSEYQKGNDD